MAKSLKKEEQECVFIALKRLSIQVELVHGIKLKFACSSRSNKQATQLS